MGAGTRIEGALDEGDQGDLAGQAALLDPLDDPGEPGTSALGDLDDVVRGLAVVVDPRLHAGSVDAVLPREAASQPAPGVTGFQRQGIPEVAGQPIG